MKIPPRPPFLKEGTNSPAFSPRCRVGAAGGKGRLRGILGWYIPCNSKLQFQMTQTILFEIQNFGHWRLFIDSVINHGKARHSPESGNPEENWIPGQARNDKPENTYVAVHRI